MRGFRGFRNDPAKASAITHKSACVRRRWTSCVRGYGWRVHLRRKPERRGRHLGRAPRALIIVENEPVPQGDVRVWHEALSLTHAGWKVVVLAPMGTRKPEPARELLDGVEIVRFPLRPASGGPADYAREYVQAMWRIWRRVARLDRDRQFDVIQACNPPDFLLLTALGPRRRGARLIFDHHDLVPEMFSERFGRGFVALARPAVRLAERLAFSLADVSLATNRTFRRIAITRGGMSADDVFVVRNGPQLERFVEVPADPTLGRGRRYLLTYVGLMAPHDGVDRGILALAELRTRRQDWHALFVGDGPMLPSLRRLVADLGLEHHVEFAGFGSELEVRRAISSADVCLAPDPRTPLTDASTLVKIAEYMSLSRPTVSFDLAESRVTAGDAAVYAPDNDPATFARLIDELLDDPARRLRMGREGRARVEGGLAWEHSERALLAAYERALDLQR
jgi:glycosyltransferase involved in cell wall biosynthesis